MSIQAVGWVLDNSASRGVDRLVLISLANHANASDLCWPAQRTIAREAGIALGTVSNAVARLVTLGELAVVEPGTTRTTARYRIVRPQARTQSSGDERRVHPGVNAESIPGVDRSIKNHQEESDSVQLDDFAFLADPDCVSCNGRGWRYHPGAGRDARCECTKTAIDPNPYQVAGDSQ